MPTTTQLKKNFVNKIKRKPTTPTTSQKEAINLFTQSSKNQEKISNINKTFLQKITKQNANYSIFCKFLGEKLAMNQNTISIPEFNNKYRFLDSKQAYNWLEQFQNLGLITISGNHITDMGRRLILKYSKIIIFNAENKFKKYGVKSIKTI